MTGPPAGARGEVGLGNESRMTLRPVQELLRAAPTGLLGFTHRGWSTHE
jgi:hypothetical protein